MDYKQAEDILRKNTSMLPRTWNEARRDADYACAIEIPKSRTQDAQDFLFGMLFIVPLLTILIYFIYMGLERLA